MKPEQEQRIINESSRKLWELGEHGDGNDCYAEIEQWIELGKQSGALDLVISICQEEIEKQVPMDLHILTKSPLKNDKNLALIKIKEVGEQLKTNNNE